MKSHEVLKMTVDKVGNKIVADELNVAPSTLYKWCEDSNKPNSSGGKNPLDRIAAICKAAHSDKPVKWLCEQRNGVFVRNTALEFKADMPVAHLAATRRVMKEFSELIGALSDSYKQDGGITQDSAKIIRKEWEDVKRAAERLVGACERGKFETSKE